MGRLPTGDRKYQIERLWDVHREILRLAVCGMAQVDIARELGITPVMVSYTMNSAIARREMELLRADRDLDAIDVAQRIQQVAPVALQVMEELLATGNDNIRLKVATDVLDRAGHAAVKRLSIDSTHHLNSADIEEIKQRARSIGLCQDACYDDQEQGHHASVARQAAAVPMVLMVAEG